MGRRRMDNPQSNILMIGTFLFFIIWAILGIINTVLGLIPITLPANIASSMTYFGNQLVYLNGYIDLPGVLGAFEFLLDFMTAWFIFKVVMWAYHMIFARRAHETQALPAQSKK